MIDEINKTESIDTSEDLRKHLEKTDYQNLSHCFVDESRISHKKFKTFAELREESEVAVYSVKGKTVWCEVLKVSDISESEDTVSFSVEDNGKIIRWNAFKDELYIVGYDFVCCPNAESNKRIVFDLVYFGMMKYQHLVQEAYCNFRGLIE